jgi:adenylate cyclase
MGIETERKYLVKGKSYKCGTSGYLYKQGYLSTNPESVIRIRICNDKSYVTIKGKAEGISRLEFEYEIPLNDAEEMLNLLCEKPIIEKHRYKYEYMGDLWEIDEFHGENEGLIVAEIELDNENSVFSKPEWLGEEVTGVTKYHNSCLVKHPFKDWDKD